MNKSNTMEKSKMLHANKFKDTEDFNSYMLHCLNEHKTVVEVVSVVPAAGGQLLIFYTEKELENE